MSLNDILIRKENGGNLELIQESIRPFLILCEMSDFFVLLQVDCEQSESELLRLLKEIGAFDKGLKVHRVMVSSTSAGKTSMIRQLQAMTHIENDPTVALALKGKIPNIVTILLPHVPTRPETSEISYASLEECVDVIKVALAKF